MEKLKILVVDDEARMRKLVSDFLVRQKFRSAGSRRRSRKPLISFCRQRNCPGDSGRDDAKDGRLGSLQGNSEIFQGADYYADGQRR